jgi:hypothetical protein
MLVFALKDGKSPIFPLIFAVKLKFVKTHEFSLYSCNSINSARKPLNAINVTNSEPAKLIRFHTGKAMRRYNRIFARGTPQLA